MTIGLDTFLNHRNEVTKEEILDYINGRLGIFNTFGGSMSVEELRVFQEYEFDFEIVNSYEEAYTKELAKFFVLLRKGGQYECVNRELLKRHDEKFWADLKAGKPLADLLEKHHKAEYEKLRKQKVNLDFELSDAKGEIRNLKADPEKKIEESAEAKAAKLFEAFKKSMDKQFSFSDQYTPEELSVIEHQKMKAREIAKKALDAEKTTSGYKALDIQALDKLLEVPDAPIEWRIKDLMQVGHNVTMAALYKVGKTTLVTNMLKALVDGDLFLDEFWVRKVTRPVVVFNHELSDAQFTAWLRKAGIQNTHMIIPVNLRGKGLYLQDEEAAEWAIEILKKYDAEVWIIDPLQAALRGTVNDDMVASDWIAAADRVKAEAGVSELFLVTHTSHLTKADENGMSSNERSAGSARWSGWPDALWSYTKDNEGIRYLSAEGRDISVSERAMDFDEKTGKLSSKGEKTGRMDNRYNKPYQAVLGLLKANPDKTYTRADITSELRKPNKFITDGLGDAKSLHMVEEIEMEREAGKRGAAPKGYRLSPVGKTLHGLAA